MRIISNSAPSSNNDAPAWYSDSFSKNETLLSREVEAGFEHDPEWWKDAQCFSQHVWTGKEINACEKSIIDKCMTDERNFTAIDTSKRIVACGDIHGDYNLLKRIMISNNLIKYRSRKWEWTAFDTIFVLCGDLVDMYRSPEMYTEADNSEEDHAEWKILMLLSELYSQNAHIIRLYGNHELMLISGRDHFRTARSKYNDQKRLPNPKELWTSTSGCYNRMLRSCGGGKAVVRINNWIFCHGGLNPSYVLSFKTLNNLQAKPGKQLGDVVLEKYNERLLHLFTNHLEEIKAGKHDWWKMTNLAEGTFAADHTDSKVSSDYKKTILWSRENADSTSNDEKCEELVQLLDDLYPQTRNTRLCVAHCVQNWEAIDSKIYSLSDKCFYNMTKTVSQETLATRDPSFVQKLTLPAAKCTYRTDLVKRAKDSKLHPTKCFYIPSINFGCVPPPHSSHDETYVLGRIFRIDCGMSRGLQYKREYLRKFMQDEKNPLWMGLDNMGRKLHLEYFFRMYDAATSPQALEIFPAKDHRTQENVNHVITSKANMFERLV